MKNRLFVVLAFTLAFFTGYCITAPASERIGIGYSFMENGTCSVAQNTLIAEYNLEEENLDVRGNVRTEPSGGDCRKDALSYDVSASRYFELFNDSIDAFVTFGANEQSSAGPYVLTNNDGMVLHRPDGNALFQTNLPAGTAKTIVGAFGLSKDFGYFRLGGGTNLVPIDWADHEPGRTVHLIAGVDVGNFDLDSTLDIGASSFGEVSLSYIHALDKSKLDVGLGLSYYWGIAKLDSGAPMYQYVDKSMFVRAGPPRNDSLVASITFGFSLK